MSRGRIVEYKNEFSNGPVGFEYLLPQDSEKPSDLSGWIRQFSNLQPEHVFSVLSRQWEPTNAITKPVVAFFSTLEPASIYLLPDEWYPNQQWLLLKNSSHVFFFVESSDIPESLSDFEEDLSFLLRAFNGIRIGFRMDDTERFLRQDSGFVSGASLRVLSECDEPWLRSRDKSFREFLPFFDTPCGNKFLAHRSGTIAKWDHDSMEITICFERTSEFVKSFTEFYSGIHAEKESPFFY